MNRIRDEINRELSGLTFEKIEKGALGELPKKRKEKNMKFNKKIITGIAAAAAVAAVTVTAGAASDWNYGKLIGGFFRDQNVTNPEAEPDGQNQPASETGEPSANPAPPASAVALLDPLLQNAEITSTFTNYNARFDGIIFDGKALMASVNIAAKDGTPFDPAHEYMGTLLAEGISMSGHQWSEVNEDGTLQVYRIFDHADISEETEVTLTYHYMLYDSDMLKYQPADELPPEEVLDPGSISATLTLDKCGIGKDVELKDADGNIINVHITPISMELIYDQSFIDTMSGGEGVPVFSFLPKHGEIYGKNGEVLIGAADYSGGVGDETGQNEKGVPFYFATFSRIIDVNEITGIDIDGFTYGEIPE